MELRKVGVDPRINFAAALPTDEAENEILAENCLLPVKGGRHVSLVVQ